MFCQVMRYLQDYNEEHITRNALTIDMVGGVKGTESLPYSSKQMKRRLRKQFGIDSIMAEIDGKPNVV